MLKPSRHDLSILAKLAIPLILGGLVESSIGFFSTLFLSHLGKQALAAGALSSWLFATMMVILWGTLTAISVLVSRKYGEKDDAAIAWILRDSFILASLFVVPTFALLWYLPSFFILLGQPFQLIALANTYVHALAFSIVPDFLYMVLIQFVIGLGRTRVSMIFTFLWVPLHILINYALVFGRFGLPTLGIAGIGWGTTISYWLTTLGLLIYLLLHPSYHPYLTQAFKRGPLQYVKELLVVGVPIGSMFSLELGFFFILSIVMGHFGSHVLAANQIALQYLGQLTAISFSIAGAITVRMGHMIGAKNFPATERAASAGILFAVILMSIVALCYWLLPHYLIGIDFKVNDSHNTALVQMATQFLAWCALFQLAESVRISLYGALRALQDTRFPFFTSIISFWCIPLPVGWLLTHYFNWSATGYWCGMVLGAMTGASILYRRTQKRLLSLSSVD